MTGSSGLALLGLLLHGLVLALWRGSNRRAFGLELELDFVDLNIERLSDLS
mgnify:CR=1 FL=1